MTTHRIADRYTLMETIGIGGMGAVYRAFDALTGQIVALKQIKFVITDSTAYNAEVLRLALAREFRTLSSIRHPNIVSVIDYGFHEGQPYFTMEYLDGGQPIDVGARTLAAEDRVELVVQMLQALTYLHRRGILHCDLKPSNVLVARDGTLKILDFGLSHNLSGWQSTPIGGGISGTVGYIAPELFMGESVSERSDLFAAGVLLYQALTDQHPFTAPNLLAQITAITSGEPALDPLDPRWRPIVARLLAKAPAARYPTAAEALRDLCAAISPTYSSETLEQREGILQSASFVGREHEIKALVTALHEAQQARGSLWLISGESGIGKSRILDEIRTQALVEGAIVYRGQGMEDGGLPYQLWRDIARRLALSVTLTDLEASILKAIAPDIAALVGRPVEDAPRLDGQAGGSRLALTLFDLLVRQAAPVVILLEDLQWTVESLEILAILAPLIRGRSILILGSFRSENTPELAASLPEAHVLRLERLKVSAIAALSASILGDAGREARFVQRLASETEGNVFFVLEWFRALAETGGGLASATAHPLPESVFTGGMQRVLSARIGRVPSWARPALELAAIIGRTIDAALLRALCPNLAWEAWETACIDAAVLEPAEGALRFTHDKLRETARRLVPDLPALHRQVAQAFETVYRDQPQYAMQRVYHWHLAGDALDEFLSLVEAGQYALQRFSVRETLDLFDRASALLPRVQNHLAQPQLMRARMLQGQGTALWRSGEYARARAALQIALKDFRAAGHHAAAGWTLESLGTVLWRMNDDDAARAVLRECIDYARDNDPLLLAYALNRLGTVEYTSGHLEAGRAWLVQAVPLVRELQEPQIIGHVIGNLGMLATETGDLEMAQAYLEEALNAYRRQGNTIGQSHAHTNLGLLAFRRGEIDRARALHRVAIGFASANGDMGTLMENVAAMARLEANRERALLWAGLVRSHPATTGETHTILKAVIERPDDDFSPDEIEVWLAQGAQLEVAAVVQQIEAA